MASSTINNIYSHIATDEYLELNGLLPHVPHRLPQRYLKILVLSPGG
jgi:hypothetical protein